MERFECNDGSTNVLLDSKGEQLLLIGLAGIARHKVGESEITPELIPGTQFTGNVLGFQNAGKTNSTYLYLHESGGLRVIAYDLKSLSVKWDKRFASDSLQRGFISADETFLGVPNKGGILEIFSINTAQKSVLSLEKLTGDKSALSKSIVALCISDDVKFLAVATAGSSLFVINIESGQLVGKMLKEKPEQISHMHFLAGTHDLLGVSVTGSICRITEEFAVQDVAPIQSLETFSFLSIAESGKVFVTASDESKSISIVETSTAKVAHNLETAD